MAIRLKVQDKSPVRLRATEGVPIYPDTYQGEYEVTPKVTAQSLATRGLMMLDDVAVLAVPYYETSNESGKTAYIANEV